jgi:ABC-type multidrug transport system fused ATPase/permease subunit
MKARLEESEQIGTLDVLRAFGRSFRYVAPFRGRFTIKAALVLLSIAPILILPWPTKVQIDHAIDGKPVGEALSEYPVFLRPLVAPLDGLSPAEILLWTIAFQALLVFGIGAMGLTGRERDETNAWLSSGHDSATRTENEANAGWSFAGGLLGLFDFRYTIGLSQAFNHYYRSRLFERIQSLPMTAFDDERIGDAIYRVMYDTPSITEVVYRTVLTPIVVPIAAGVTALVLWHVYGEHPPLFWLPLSFLPIVLAVTFPFAALLRRREVRSRQAGATTTSTLEEGVSNILAVQSLGGAERERKRFDRDSWESFTRYRFVMLAGMLAFLAAAVPGAWIIGAGFLYVAGLVIEGSITRGDTIVLMGYYLTMLIFAVELGALWIRIQRGGAGLHRVFFLMDLPAEQDIAGARPLPRVRRGVRVENVHFRYDDGTEALRGVNFEAPVGEITAFVGPAGAGKTTLAYLIPRFVTPQEGRVLLDGIDVESVTRDSLRSQVAFVFQESALFDGTVEENLRLGRLDATEIEIRRAAQLAGADEFVRELPDGYQTQLGRAGAKLSVGQKQRLAIARALVRDAPILILDEPTSALDPATERRLVEALRAASRSRLVIVIAHRLSTVRAADEILFLEAGRIIEQGSHDELMARPGGAYRRYVELQTRGTG